MKHGVELTSVLPTFVSSHYCFRLLRDKGSASFPACVADVPSFFTGWIRSCWSFWSSWYPRCSRMCPSITQHNVPNVTLVDFQYSINTSNHFFQSSLSLNKLLTLCLLSLLLQGDRGETGPPGPAGFAGPPVSDINNTERFLALWKPEELGYRATNWVFVMNHES